MTEMKRFAGMMALVAVLLTGCIPSKLATTITDEQRAEYQAACNEVRGTFYGNLPHEVPTCKVEYTYPAIPDLTVVDFQLPTR